jgi:hypothetical protein
MAITNTTTWSEYVQTAFDTTVAWFLRDMPMFRQIVDKRPRQSGYAWFSDHPDH